jgi:lipopolysaccharide transport system permease protein
MYWPNWAAELPLDLSAVPPPSTVTAPDLRVYRPVSHRLRVREIWTTREVARMIGLRDIKVKYKQAALGPLWLLIAPLGMLAAMGIAFSGVTSVNTGGVPYVLFTLVGLVVWTYIQLSLSVGAQAVVGNSPLVRRSAMPRIALVTGTLLGNLPPVAVMLALTLVGTLAARGLPLQIVLLPVVAVWAVVFTLALTMLVAAVAARFRDTVAVMPLLVQAGIFVTPVGYPIEGAPRNIKLLLSLNPVSGIIESWRWVILGSADTSLAVIGVALGATVLLCVFGWYVFSRLEVTFADVV